MSTSTMTTTTMTTSAAGSAEDTTASDGLSTALDPDRLQALLGQAVNDLGAVPSAALVVLGDRLGLFTALAQQGAQTSDALARATGTEERYVREWARALAAGGYLTYLADQDAYAVSAEQSLVLVPGGPVHVPSAAAMWLSAVTSLDTLQDAFRSGRGISWNEQGVEVWRGTDAFYRPGYEASLVHEWVPALDGVVQRLRAGAQVADIGTGYGSAPIILAHAFPDIRVTGFDDHAASVQAARQAAVQAEVADRVDFEVSDAASFPGSGYDLVTTMDALHDLGDPVGAARRVYDALAADGTWMVVEPAAADRVEDNLNPVGRLFYAASTLLCVPHARSQGGEGLGAQAGAAAVESVARQAGFTRVRLATRTAFNAIYEIRR
jgi:SAM-dependent methyltransferase